MGENYIYVVDYARGINILGYDPTAPLPTKREFRASWLAKLNVTDPLSEAERYFCSLNQGQKSHR